MLSCASTICFWQNNLLTHSRAPVHATGRILWNRKDLPMETNPIPPLAYKVCGEIVAKHCEGRHPSILNAADDLRDRPRLVAAKDDLLEACKDVVIEFEGHCPPNMYQGVWDKLEAAIAKATAQEGESDMVQQDSQLIEVTLWEKTGKAFVRADTIFAVVDIPADERYTRRTRIDYGNPTCHPSCVLCQEEAADIARLVAVARREEPK